MIGDVYRQQSASRQTFLCLQYPPINRYIDGAGKDPGNIKAPIVTYYSFTQVLGRVEPQTKGVP